MISFEMEDLIGVLQGLTPYFIAIGVILLAAIAITVAVKKLPKEKKGFLRGETWMAAILAIAIVVNLILTGPMAALLSLVAGSGETRTTLTEELTEEAEGAALRIAEEGFVLLQNDGLLPMEGKKLNLFGWASTNPVYGGAGSGGINAAPKDSDFTVYLSKEDHDRFNPEFDSIAADYADKFKLNFAVDRELESGNFRLENDSTIVECGLGPELRGLIESLDILMS